MDVQLRTALGNSLRHDVDGGPLQSVEHAVSLLHAQETWVSEQRAESHSTAIEGRSQRPLDSGLL